MKQICVFAGSNSGSQPDTGRRRRNWVGCSSGVGSVCVYGGGRVGLMGALADSVLAAQGHVIGVIPAALLEWEVAHAGLSELRVVASMHERKAMMAEMADGFIALPGGLGTLEELFEVLTWGQLGLHQKPCGLLNVRGYFDGLLSFIDHSVTDGFLRPENRSMILVADSAAALMELLEHYVPPAVEKWIDRAST